MKNFVICGAVFLLLLASCSASDCQSSLPAKICDHLNKLENRMTRLATRSTYVITKAVENAAERNAKLFAKAVEILRNSTSVKKNTNATDLLQILKGLTERFEKVKAAQADIAKDAMEAIAVGATRVAELIQKIITDATDADHTDAAKFRQQLRQAAKQAHSSIRKATLEAIRKVAKSNQRARQYFVRMLKDIGMNMASEIETVVDSVSEAGEEMIADNAEHEMEADFDAATNEAFEVIVQADSGVSKRGWNEFWGKVKSKFQQLGALILQKVKEAIQLIKPAIYENLRDIEKIILQQAKKLIVEIAGQIFVIST